MKNVFGERFSANVSKKEKKDKILGAKTLR